MSTPFFTFFRRIWKFVAGAACFCAGNVAPIGHIAGGAFYFFCERT